jgi:hypothetical protein
VSALGLQAALAQDLPVRVSTYAEHQGGNVVYHYEVRNNGPGELREFYIGCDCTGGQAAAPPQLRVLPAGARPAAIDDAGTWLESGVTAPTGWRVRVLQPRGASGHWIAWRMAAARTKAGVGPGQTLTGFSVAVPASDTGYLDGYFTARTLHNGKFTDVSAPISLLDTTPPTLSLQAVPAAKGQGDTAVRVTATAKDDRDREPRVVAESIVRTEGAAGGGRSYTIMYSATDASGNRATSSVSVILPAATEPAVQPPSKPNGTLWTAANLPWLVVLP